MLRSIIHRSAFDIIRVDVYEKLVIQELIFISTHDKASGVSSEKLIFYRKKIQLFKWVGYSYRATA
jgi:hypothetical protein